MLRHIGEIRHEGRGAPLAQQVGGLRFILVTARRESIEGAAAKDASPLVFGHSEILDCRAKPSTSSAAQLSHAEGLWGEGGKCRVGGYSRKILTRPGGWKLERESRVGRRMAVEPIRAWAQRETMRRTTAERLDGSSSSGSSSSRALGAADRGLGLLQEGGRQACCNHDMLLFRGMDEGFQASPPNSAVERCVSL